MFSLIASFDSEVISQSIFISFLFYILNIESLNLTSIQNFGIFLCIQNLRFCYLFHFIYYFQNLNLLNSSNTKYSLLLFHLIRRLFHCLFSITILLPPKSSFSKFEKYFELRNISLHPIFHILFNILFIAFTIQRYFA